MEWVHTSIAGLVGAVREEPVVSSSDADAAHVVAYKAQHIGLPKYIKYLYIKKYKYYYIILISIVDGLGS